MKRRNFFKGLLALGAGFSILPPATTYARLWTAQRKIVHITQCNNMPYSNRDFAGTWKFVCPELGYTENNPFTSTHLELITDTQTLNL